MKVKRINWQTLYKFQAPICYNNKKTMGTYRNINNIVIIHNLNLSLDSHYQQTKNNNMPFIHTLILSLLLLLFLPSHSEFFSYDGDNYTTTRFADMADRQTDFVLDTWLVPQAWVNPSMVLDPAGNNKVVMVWRMPDKVVVVVIIVLQLDFIILIFMVVIVF